MGPGRTVNGAYQLRHASNRRKKDEDRRTVRAPGRWSVWARDFLWSERADAYDQHVEAEVRATNVGNIAAARRREKAGSGQPRSGPYLAPPLPCAPTRRRPPISLSAPTWTWGQVAPFSLLTRLQKSVEKT